METKSFHFQAAAQYRKSLEDLEAHQYVVYQSQGGSDGAEAVHSYGLEVARLTEAYALAKRGYDVARRGSVAQPVLQDIKVRISIVLLIQIR